LNILGNGRVVEQHRAHAENAACFDKRNGPAELLLQCRWVLVLGKCSMWSFGFENLIGNIAEHILTDLYVHSSLTLIICLKHGPSKMVPSHAPRQKNKVR